MSHTRFAPHGLMITCLILAGLGVPLSAAAFDRPPHWWISISEGEGASGGINYLTLKYPEAEGNWLSGSKAWGTGWIHTPGYSAEWDKATSVTSPSKWVCITTYETPILRVVVRRELDAANRLLESYTFTNLTTTELDLPGGALGIYMPLADSYRDQVQATLTGSCNVHLWMGGSSAWMSAMRMSGKPPYLGMVLTAGSLDRYSIADRPQHSNDRGVFVLHPAAMRLAPEASSTVSWALFAHTGWDDLFAKALAIPGFIRMQTANYTVVQGQPIELSAESATALTGSEVYVNGISTSAIITGNRLTASLPTTTMGEQTIEVRQAGRNALLRAWVTPDPMELIKQRVAFIVRKQQKHAPGQSLDGAFLAYDNETNEQVFKDDQPQNHNGSRERNAMGVLAALYLPLCKDAALRKEITKSLAAYLAFIEREHQDPTGRVFDQLDRKGERMYNYPWVAHLHLALAAQGDRLQLVRFVDTVRAYYEQDGENFYCIGMPVLDGLAVVLKANLKPEYDELLGLFRKHADHIVQNGIEYPAHEVKFEQSIVAPAVQILLETYLVTKDQRYLDSARTQLAVLEAFCGRQPDHRLHDIAIRHWDGFWFGKLALYGDIFPHYWTALTGVVFARYAAATGDQAYAHRAAGIINANLSSFQPDGRATCAFVYPWTINGTPAHRADPYANDQDWALVMWLETLGKRP